ncbi:putative zinc-type alcohol dehydrogenase-like protein YdjJ [Lycorma delicatula]|uniref:putative zinc-type alcohol dehydrogenase-like protein YdjJ n=1 Tax=Lycorma delicatula TaxID=130591 RepID=UPI003F50FA0F
MCSDNLFQPTFFKPTMEALQLLPQKHTLSLVTTDIPVIVKPDDVIVKVMYAGICGTDLHIIDGKFPCSQQPIILGHELSGTVYATGSEVKVLQRGDRVGIDPNRGCGLCRYCHTGSYNLCPTGSINSAVGVFRDGGWAQFCKVPSVQVYRLPPNVSFKQAALLEPLSCVYHGYSRICPIHYSSKILITGAGIIGNLWCCLFHHTGHRNVTVSEPEEARRELVKRLDTGFTITNPSEINKIFCNDSVNGIDVCIENSGNCSAIEQSFNLLNRGGKLCIFGVPAPDANVSLSPFQIFLKEITVYGVTINPYTYRHAIGLMEAMGARYIDYDRLGIRIYSLKEYQEAFDELKKGGITKAVFKIDPSAE